MPSRALSIGLRALGSCFAVGRLQTRAGPVDALNALGGTRQDVAVPAVPATPRTAPAVLTHICLQNTARARRGDRAVTGGAVGV